MFVFGLLIGPALGLLAGDALFRQRVFDPRVGTVLIGLVLIFVLFASVFSLQLKLGLIVGIALGLLLAATPSLTGDGAPQTHD